MSVVGYTVAEELFIRSYNEGFGVNPWDVPLEVVNNIVILLFVLVPLFLLVAGDVASQDRVTGYVRLVIPRTSSRWRWWRAKVFAVGAAAAIFFAMTAVLLSVVGGLVLGGWGGELSEYGAAFPGSSSGSAVEAAKFYGPPPFRGGPAAWSVLVVYGYTAVAVWAYATFCLALTVRWAKPWIPVLTTVVVTLVFFTMPPATVLHPLIHLVWDAHTFSVANVAVTWWASGLLMSAELLFSLGVGFWQLRRCDLVKEDA